MATLDTNQKKRVHFERLKNLAAPLPPSYLRRQGSSHLSGLAGKHPLEVTSSLGVLAVLV